MTFSGAVLNFLGGIPDRAFSLSSCLLRRPCPMGTLEYPRALRFYERYLGDGTPLALFDLPNRAPKLVVKRESGFGDGARMTFAFPSGYRVKNPAARPFFKGNARNRTAYLHLWRHAFGKPRPLVLCLHGFLLGNARVAERMFNVRRLFESGVDVGLFVLPHHGDRTNFFLNQDFVVPRNLPLVVESFAQTQHDLHAAMLALRREGYGRIGMIGASLGGYAGIYYAALSSFPAFLFAVVPTVRLDDYLMPEAARFPFPVTEEIRAATIAALGLIAPENYRPRVPVENIGVVIHAGDKLNDVRRTSRWIKAWGIRRVTEVPGGHWLYFDGKARGRAWYSWLVEKGFLPEKGRRAAR